MKKKLNFVFVCLVFCLYILHRGVIANVDDEASVSEEDYEYAIPELCDEGLCREGLDRRKRSDVKAKSKVLDVMLQTQMFHLNRAQTLDPLSILRDHYELPKGFKGPLAEYDFIVVGAGSAGSVVASRLSEGQEASVLLLEAGLGESWITDVPIMAPYLQQTDYVWHYLMEKQPGVCMGMTNGRCFWPRGKAIGGSSVVNYMIYTRGLAVDWNRIAADGNYGWSYENVLPYYMKSENARLRGLTDSPWHGRTGEMSVEDVPFRSKLGAAFLEAGKYLGHRRVDYNSPDGFGFSYIQATMTNGHRVSSAKAFLHKKKKRKNLHILSSSRVTKILIDPSTKTTYGVEFIRNNRKYQIRAKKEVILSAGPIESPHLLMLSGIGPKEHLESFGIPVISDLQVGQTLYDHISFPGLTFTVNTSNLSIRDDRLATVANVVQYTQYGDGPLSSLAGVETIGYIKTNVSEEVGDVPDIELIGTCSSFAGDKGTIVSKGLHIDDTFYKEVFSPLENGEAFTIMLILLHPKSKGRLELKSKSPLDDPKMYGNYMRNTKDTDTMVAAVRYIQKLIDTPAFKKYGAKVYPKRYSTCLHLDFDTDRYWECAIRTITATIHHQITTCKMGPSSDPEAVVDPELRVYGVNNLRVIDSSIIPRTIAAHTNAPAIMIGEKGADMIKRTWGMGLYQ